MKKLFSLISLIYVFFASGCAVVLPPRALPPEVSIEEVIKMSQAGVPPPTIINKIDSSHTVYHLKSEDILNLKQDGVPFEIIDFMLATEKRDIAAHEQARWHQYYYDRDAGWWD